MFLKPVHFIGRLKRAIIENKIQLNEGYYSVIKEGKIN